MSEVDFSDYELTYNDKGWGVTWCLQHKVTQDILASGTSRTIDDMAAEVEILLGGHTTKKWAAR